MPTLTTTNATNVREDLGNIISMISPEETPFITAIGKTKATQKTHEWLQDELAAANKDNAAAEGADAADATLSVPVRLSNQAQIFTKSVQVSDTFEATNTAGAKSELARQLMKAGKEIKRDIEAALVSANPSVSAGTRKLGGAEAWIATNALHGTDGATAGYSGGLVGAVTPGTARPFTEEMFQEALQGAYDAGGNVSKVIAPPSLKAKIGTFTGGATKQQMADKKTVSAGVDIYDGDFGVYDILPHRFMSSTTVIAFDPDLWNQAVLRSINKTELAKTGDSTKYMLRAELTLECLNEAGNAKIADLNG
ncbi:DUF5309 family protein [Sinorhizobium meliloti]|uniref:SU10 major capsid protein n=1 Tax=Rhizobium meliloti TaxID=382 RepID=UPI00299D7A96|nr:head protein [Sinorhizobium meliloti]MDW9991053.1 head protein [Sinorhizobium meliloti]MDX0245453.1 head protein [Sinorhizobium meliloti]MDX0401543.1 head protein [Sinorhizobium meliloti]